jgi:2-oxoglutarate ferredoxin oxidoreductase subunit gamma
MFSKQITIAGFGGQGIQFTGKFLIYAGMQAGYEVSCIPSYGPEMRGGTSACFVVISDDKIGSPIFTDPDILIAMNLPSFDKYESGTKAGGYTFVDSTLVERKANRDDVNTVYVPATGVASENGMHTLANMIMVGKVLKETGIYDYELIEKIMPKLVSAKRPQLIEMNLKAIKLGLEL